MQCKTLTTAITQVLQNKGKQLTYEQIASEIGAKGLWARRHDGRTPTAWHVYDRIRRCPRSFVVDRSTLPHTVWLNSAEVTE